MKEALAIITVLIVSFIIVTIVGFPFWLLYRIKGKTYASLWKWLYGYTPKSVVSSKEGRRNES